jgi:hypothetical protein
VLSLTFGLIILFANPPLRGPDEIAHFLRIYSYARGELLPPSEINGRKGIFLGRDLYDQLYFLKNAGERFARAEEQIRYGQIMAEYRNLAIAGTNALEQPPGFAPFAGTEGYNAVAYTPISYRRGSHRTRAQTRSCRHAALDALLRRRSLHGGGGLRDIGLSGREMGVRVDRNAARPNLPINIRVTHWIF